MAIIMIIVGIYRGYIPTKEYIVVTLYESGAMVSVKTRNSLFGKF